MQPATGYYCGVLCINFVTYSCLFWNICNHCIYQSRFESADLFCVSTKLNPDQQFFVPLSERLLSNEPYFLVSLSLPPCIKAHASCYPHTVILVFTFTSALAPVLLTMFL